MDKPNFQQWRLLLDEFRNSGLTGKAWCKDKGIKPSTLYYWIKRFKNKNTTTVTSPRWASLSMPENSKKEVPGKITIRIKDFSLEIDTNFDKEALADALSVVMQLC